MSNSPSKGVVVGSSSYSGSVGKSLKGLGGRSNGPFLGELVLAALEACKLCWVGKGCCRVDYLREASLAFSPCSSLNML